MMKWTTIALVLMTLLMVAGCATTKPTQQAVVCPGCQSVLVGPESGLEAFAFHLAGGEHRCPGCQGALRTWLTEGKWHHQCSLCQQQPYTCAAHDW